MSESHLKAIVDVLEAMTTQWLAANHFRTRKLRRQKDSGSLSPAGSETPAAKTPTPRNQGAFQSATTSKKRKYVDITGRTRLFEQDGQTVANSPGDHFSSWSRIKVR